MKNKIICVSIDDTDSYCPYKLDLFNAKRMCVKIQEVSIEKKAFVGLNSNQLKIIGCVLMVMDHIHQMFYINGVPDWFTWLGRLVAPIFLFLCAEGFFYTHNRKKYMIQLYIGFAFMSIASNILSNVLPSENVLMNNIFGTLFLCTLYMSAMDFLKKGVQEKNGKNIFKGIGLMLLPVLTSVLVIAVISIPNISPLILQLVMLIPNLITTEGGFLFVALGVWFYIFRTNRWLQCAGLAALSVIIFLMGDPVQALMIFAIVFMLLYNGQRGNGNKYFFYIFYPAHIYILYILAYFING